MVGAPEIYGKDVTKTSLPEISKTVKESTADLTEYQTIIADLEKNVVLKQAELEKQKLRNISYSTNANWGGDLDMGDGKGARRVSGKRIYDQLATTLKEKSGYTPPENTEDKVLHDIVFRLQELGFAKNIDLSQKIEYTDMLAREIIAFQKLANLKGQEGVVGQETLRALLQGKAKATVTPEVRQVSEVDQLVTLMEDMSKNGYGHRYQEFIINFNKALEILGYLDPNDKIDGIYPDEIYEGGLMHFNKNTFGNEEKTIQLPESVSAMTEALKNHKNNPEQKETFNFTYNIPDDFDLLDVEYEVGFGNISISAIRNNIKNMEKNLEAIRESHATIIQKRTALKKILDEIKKADLEKKEVDPALLDESVIIKKELNEVLDMKKKILRNNDKQLISINSKIQGLKKDIKQTKDYLKLFQTETDKLTDDIRTLETKKEEYTKANKDSSEIDARLKNLNEKKAKWTPIRKQFEDMNNSIQELKTFDKEIDDANKKIEQYNKEFEEYNKNIDQSNAELLEVYQDLAQYAQKYSRAQMLVAFNASKSK